MYWSVADYFVKYGYRQKDIEKARVYELIQKHPGVTRKKLYLDMAVRPNNVSAPVQELIDSGLVYEEQQKSQISFHFPFSIMIQSRQHPLVLFSRPSSPDKFQVYYSEHQQSLYSQSYWKIV